MNIRERAPYRGVAGLNSLLVAEFLLSLTIVLSSLGRPWRVRGRSFWSR